MADIDPNVNYTGSVSPERGNIDRSITSLSGSSQTLLNAPEGVRRKRIIFVNGAATVAVNLKGGTAAIGAAACATLLPYQILVMSGDDCPQDPMTIIGTATNYFTAFEGF